MDDRDWILNASVVCSEQEVLAEFQECCAAEAEAARQCTDELDRAAADQAGKDERGAKVIEGTG